MYVFTPKGEEIFHLLQFIIILSNLERVKKILNMIPKAFLWKISDI